MHIPQSVSPGLRQQQVLGLQQRNDAAGTQDIHEHGRPHHALQFLSGADVAHGACREIDFGYVSFHESGRYPCDFPEPTGAEAQELSTFQRLG